MELITQEEVMFEKIVATWISLFIPIYIWGFIEIELRKTNNRWIVAGIWILGFFFILVYGSIWR